MEEELAKKAAMEAETLAAAQPFTPAEESSGLLDPSTYQAMADWLITNGMNLLYALVIFAIGKWVAGFARNRIRNLMAKKNVDAALVSFGTNILYYVLLTIVAIAAIQKLGFQTTSFIAILGAAGLAVGFALQGSLSNFASGVMIMLFRPFNIDDLIEAAGETGVVQDMGVLVTTLRSLDNKKIIVPNSAIMSGSITNLTGHKTRRVDMTVGVSYADDLDRVRELILETLRSDDRVLQDPAPQVEVCELADSSVNFTVRPWTETKNYWAVNFAFYKAIKQRLDKEGITIPFPQQDVHMHRVHEFAS